MNPISTAIWKFFAKRRLSQSDLYLRFSSYKLYGEIGKIEDIEDLVEGLYDQSQLIRNEAASSIKAIIEKNIMVEPFDATTLLLKNQLTAASGLVEQLTIVEVLGALPIEDKEDLLIAILAESENDLKYAIVKSLMGTTRTETLDVILNSAETVDLILRKVALKTWYEGMVKLPFEAALEYGVPRLHSLIRAEYELQYDGEFLRKVMSHADVRNLPDGKAYPDFIIRYLTELLSSWEYDPEAFRTLHALVVPSYFSFEKDPEQSERPFIIL